jgi:glutathione synthase/RimK-type ligase-like ATP-grasp enzyme
VASPHQANEGDCRLLTLMEINDNPNIEHGVEDQVGKDAIWIRLIKWFVDRFER